MKIKNSIKIVIKVLLLFTVVGFQACSEVADAINQASGKDVHSAHVIIDAEEISSVYVDDANISEVRKENFRKYLNVKRVYAVGDKTGQTVDNDIYNFLVKFSISSPYDIHSTFRITRSFNLNVYKCNNRLVGSSMNSYFVNIKDNKFIYEMHSTANSLAQYGFFDKVEDLCVNIDMHRDRMTDKYDYTSNEARIPAQEIRDMLDGLGIVHD